MYLIYAEAANELWGPTGDPKGYGYTAKSIIAGIRQRAKIIPDNYINTLTITKEFETLIRNERRIELSFEGFRFWDIRRWGLDMNESAKGVEITRIPSGDPETPDSFQYKEVIIETRNYQPYMQYGPIPKNQLLKSDALIQNNGWN